MMRRSGVTRQSPLGEYGAIAMETITKLRQACGPTPIEVVNIIRPDGRRQPIHLKLESHALGGSIKGRTGLQLIASLIETGAVSPDTTIIESTSGNLGVALAKITSKLGIKFRAIVDPNTPIQKINAIKQSEAEVEVVTNPDHSGGYLIGRLARVNQLLQENSSWAWTDQYHNMANPLAHYTTTAPEIFRQMHCSIDAIFVAVSTGGTLEGIGRYFRGVSPKTKIIAVDEVGSVVFEEPRILRKRHITGMGAAQRSTFITNGNYDGYTLVTHREAFQICQLLFESTGIKVGGSSGAVIAACANYMSEHSYLERVVCLCADGGDGYDELIFNGSWDEVSPYLMVAGFEGRG